MEKINIIDLIYNQIEKENKIKIEEKKKEDKGFRHFPSSLCAKIDNEFVGKCRRATYYSLMNLERTNPIDPVALFKMGMGNIIHDFLDEKLNKALVEKYGKEVSINCDTAGAEKSIQWKSKDLKYPISGRLDKIVKFDGKINGVVAGEWKSTYGFGVNYIKKEGAKIESILQCLAYLEQDVIPIDCIWLVYVARDSGYLYGYQIEKHNNKLVSKHLNSDITKEFDINWPMVVEALSFLEESLDNEIVPEPDHNAFVNPNTNKLMQKSDWQCRYCSYRSLCTGCDDE